MPGPQPIKTKAARELIEKFPHTSKKELGKMLFKLHPLLFKDEENGREFIRAVTGAHRGKDITYSATHKHIYKGPLSIPKGEINDYSHFKIHTQKIGILNDIHIPYHDYDALSIAITELKRQKVETVILNGDIIDCFMLSNFDRKPDKMAIKGEVDILCHFIDDLQKMGFKVVYKFGNHEERFERFIVTKAAALWGIELFSLKETILFQFEKLFERELQGVDFVTNKRIIDIGHLAVIHGHEFGESVFSPVNTARGFYLRGKANVIGGHSHQTSEHTESNLNGKIVSTWSIGCLCDLHPEYRPLNKWNLGMAIVEHDPETGEFEVFNKKILSNGKIV